MQSSIDSQGSQGSRGSRGSRGSSRRSVWLQSVLPVAGVWTLGGAIVAVGIVSAYTWLPKPSVPAAVTRSLKALRSPFDAEAVNAPVAAVPASRGMVAAIQRAQALEARGRFDDATRAAWNEAADEVQRLSWLPVACGQGRHVRLFLKEAEEARMADIGAWLEQLVPGQFAALEAQRIVAVEADTLREATIPPVTWLTVAANAPDDVRELATSLATMHEEAAANTRIIGAYRDLVGYDYWKAVCQAGASEPGFRARAALWRANYVAQQDQLEQAKAEYEDGFQAWQAACGAVPALGSNPHVAEEMRVHQARYHAVLGALDEASLVPEANAATIDL